jgi:hypothetical protein
MPGIRRLAVIVLAGVTAIALPCTASAQQRGGRSGSGSHGRPAAAQPPPALQPSIGLPLPEIVPPLPPLGLPPAGTHPSVGIRPPHVSQPIYRNGHRGSGHGAPYPIGGIGYFVPAFGWGYGYPLAEPELAPAPEAAPYVQAQPPPYGTLRVEVLAAAAAQVYVDGYYTGTADQAAAGLDLEPGPHRVELRATGYESLTFDVRITPNQVITFREAMKPAPTTPATPEPAARPAAPSTFYVIPGCYVGNVPPANAKLPEGCDGTKVQTFKQ